MKVALSSIGRFYFYALAVELQERGMLSALYTGYPRYKTAQAGIDRHLTHTFPYLMAPKMMLRLPSRIDATVSEAAMALHDRWTARQLVDCDIFHGLSRYNLLAGREAKRRGAKFILDVGSAHIAAQDRILRERHAAVGLRWPGFGGPGYRRELAEYEEADAIFLLSEFARSSFIEYGIPASKLFVTPPGVDVRRFSTVAGSEDVPEKFRVLTVGHLGVRKGVDVLVQAFERASLGPAELILIGSSSEITSRLIGTPSDRVRVMGQISNAELADWYRSASVFVLPSFEDGFGMVALEAMACGCPVIISRNAGAADVVEEGVNGFRFTAGDVDTLAALLVRMREMDGDAARAMRRNAARITQRNRSWSQYADTIVRQYQTLLAAG